jgi:hypothetical protein
MKRGTGDLIAEKGRKDIQIGNGAANGAPQHPSIAHFFARYCLSTGRS